MLRCCGPGRSRGSRIATQTSAEELEIRFFAAEIADTELQPTVFEQVAWVLPRELGEYDFLKANARLVADLATGRIKPGWDFPEA